MERLSPLAAITSFYNMADNRQTQLQLNFNGGQVSESFTPRVDMQRYLTSCSRMRNFIPRQYGKLQRRPGFKLVDRMNGPFRMLYFPCTSEDIYIVCLHAGVKPGLSGFATIYQCGHLDEYPRPIWNIPLDLKQEYAKNGWTSGFTVDELKEVKYVSQNDKLWIVHKNHYPIVLTRTRDDSGNITFKLTEFTFLIFPSSDDYLDSMSDTIGSEFVDIGMISMPQSDYPDIEYNAKSTTAFASMFCDIPFLYDPSWDFAQYGTIVNKWLKGWQSGDIVNCNIRTRATDAYYTGQLYNWTEINKYPQFLNAVNIIFAYVQGEWKIDVGKEFDNSYAFYVSGMSIRETFQGLNKGISIANVSNATQPANRRVTITGSAPHGYFLGFAFTNSATNGIHTAETIRNLPVELTCADTVSINSYPFATYINQKNYNGSANNGTVLRNINILPMAFCPDRTNFFNDIATNYFRLNYFVERKLVGINNYKIIYYFNTLVKSAFNVQKGYPSAVTIRRGRLIFAGTKAQPQTIWASRVDRYEDFSVDDQSDSGWNLTIGANQAQVIQWLSSSKDLIVGTDIGEWVINDDDLNSPVPTIKEQSRWGSSTFQGELMTESLFFVPKDRKGLIHSLYSFQIDGYQSEDVSIVASDLLESGITSQSIMKDPDPIWWGTSEDGKMLGFLFNRTQEIQGWHWHDIQGGKFKQVVCYHNPVKRQEGIFACIQCVPPAGSTIPLDNAEYYLAYMDFDHPCIDFPTTAECGPALLSGAGFLGEWTSFASKEVVTGNIDPLDYYLASSLCWQDGDPGQLVPYSGIYPKIDIITQGNSGFNDGKTTGYCWTFTGELNPEGYYSFSNGALTGGRIGFSPTFEAGNNALVGYSMTGTFSSFLWGLHIESEFISMPMGNTANYIIPAMTTKINQLRYQVSRDTSDDIAPNGVVMGDYASTYGYPRIQAQVEALDYSAPLGMKKNDTLGIRLYLNNGRGHEVLSGPSSTDTRLYFAFTDAKNTDVLSAYIIYDSNLV